MAAILNFIADHPGQAFTLTDLVKALKLSRATCHALLTGLVEVGYLYRASDKNYILGPALASIGRIASQHASPLQVAQPEMRALADQFDLICAAFFRERDEIIVRDRASSVSHVGWSAPVGTRLRMSPSLGSAFHTWLPDAEVDGWIESFGAVGPEFRQSVLRGMDFMREHGFQIHVRNAAAADAGSAEHPYSAAAIMSPTLQLGALEEGVTYQVDAVVAPVFELRGQIAFVLALVGFDRPYTGVELEAMGKRLREACERVSSFMTGRPAKIVAPRA